MNFTDLFGLFTVGFGLLIPLCMGAIFLVVIGIIAFFAIRGFKKSNAVYQAAQSWPSTTGVILSSQLVWEYRSHGRREQEAQVIFQYQVNGQSYQSHTVRAGEEVLRARLPGQAQAIVARYPAGAQVTVYYDPANPKDGVLER
jgi:hypothetical protein